MSDEEEILQKPEPSPSSLPKDWSPDNFPTSPKKVFTFASLMVGGIIILCAWVYFSSEHPADPKKEKKKETIQQNLESIQDSDEEEEE